MAIINPDTKTAVDHLADALAAIGGAADTLIASVYPDDRTDARMIEMYDRAKTELAETETRIREIYLDVQAIETGMVPD